MKALIVGIGSIGRRHLANLRKLAPDAEIAALRRQPEAVDGVAHVFTRRKEGIAFRPDVVLLTGPAPGRASLAREFVEHGAHVFLEKPADVDLYEVDALLGAAERQRRTVMVGFVLRFDPTVRALRQKLCEGMIGRLISLRAEVGQALPEWRPDQDYRSSISAKPGLGGGAVFELCHELDLARWLGGPVARVTSLCGCAGSLEVEVEDSAEIGLAFTSRAFGSVHVDFVRRPASRRMELAGEAGILRADLLQGRVSYLGPDGRELAVFRRLNDDSNQPYVAELAHFLECVRTGRAPLTNGRAGRATLALALAAHRSSREKRAIVP